MFLSSVTIEGFRAAAEGAFTCRFPDRFSVLLGQNNAGKTTVCDALYLAHVHKFPTLRRPSAAVLGPNPRSVDIGFDFGGHGPEGPLGASLLDRSEGPPRWTRRLERSLGNVRAVGIDNAQHVDEVRLIYLPAHRNPVDELAARETKVLVELLRAEQQRRRGHRNLADIRHLADRLLDGLTSHDLIGSVQMRVSDYLGSLTGGVGKHFAFVGGQEIDDAFLARVLEFLLSGVDARGSGQRLEVSALGYVNLLHIAVTLAAIPGGESVPRSQRSHNSEHEDDSANSGLELQPSGSRNIRSADAEAEAIEDSFFPELFHAVVVVEEPEAHLHPQLQHGLMRYLRQVTLERPELQLIVSTHSAEMITACRPEDIVVLRRDASGTRTSKAIKQLPLSDSAKARVLRLTALHFDASRSATLFAERLVLVEGVTDALITRHIGRAWAGADDAKQQFIDALTVVPVGSKVGEWSVQLLATPGYELVARLALLRDSDRRDGFGAAEPSWMNRYDSETVQCFINHPTLEPALTFGNENLVESTFATVGIDSSGDLTPQLVDELFHAGPGRRRKGEFAFALAAEMESAIDRGEPPTVPEHFEDMFEFLYAQPSQVDEVLNDAAAAAD